MTDQRIGLFETIAHFARTDAERVLAQANERDLLKALKELLEASEIDPTDLPNHEYEAIKADAQKRARLIIKRVEAA